MWGLCSLGRPTFLMASGMQRRQRLSVRAGPRLKHARPPVGEQVRTPGHAAQSSATDTQCTWHTGPRRQTLELPPHRRRSQIWCLFILPWAPEGEGSPWWCRGQSCWLWLSPQTPKAGASGKRIRRPVSPFHIFLQEEVAAPTGHVFTAQYDVVSEPEPSSQQFYENENVSGFTRIS